MEIVVTGRHCEVSERFRRHVQEKLAKVTQLAPRVQRLDVELSHEAAKRQSPVCDRVEITVRAKGPVIRAEASADEPYAALDLATAKLLERLRRARDRRKVHHGRHTPVSLHEATAAPPAPLATVEEAGDAVGMGSPSATTPSDSATTAAAAGGEAGAVAGIHALEGDGDSPVVIREKEHRAGPMSLEQALYEMELVGHDFYLFVDVADGRPSVVYRRRGWSYGVIRLRPESAEADAAPAEGLALAGDAVTGASPLSAAASANGHGVRAAAAPHP